MNGGRTESTLILIDGVSASTGSQWNGLFYSPTLDAVQEVQIVRNSYDAQFGKSGGGVLQTNAAVFIIRVYPGGAHRPRRV
jgi:outer membrane cobalamin receptor